MSQSSRENNKFLMLPFWEFAVLSALMVVFFPWSLICCLIFRGIKDTSLLVAALFHDFLKTVGAVLCILLPIAALVLWYLLKLAGKI